MMSAVGMLVG